MEVKVRVKKADLEKCETQLDIIKLVSGEWLKQHTSVQKKITRIERIMLQPGFAIRTAAVEEMFLKDLPEGVTLLPHNFEGETTRVKLKFAVSQQAVNNEKFDLNGFIKTKFDKTLTAIRHRRNIKELRLTRQMQVVIDPKSGREKTQIYFHIDYANE